MSPQNLGDLELVPFTDDLEVQFGQEVLCLPYTISPFSVVDIARSAYSKVTLDNQHFKIIPSTFRTNLFASYPILLPLYLARYEYQQPGQKDLDSVTVFMEAWTPKGRILSESTTARLGDIFRELLPNAPRALRSFSHIMDSEHTMVLRGLPRPFLSISSPSRPGLRLLIERQLENILSQPHTSKMLAFKSNLLHLDGDPRVRKYNGDDRSAILRWMSMSQKIASLKNLVASMQQAGDSGPIYTIMIGKTSASPFSDALKTLKDEIQNLEAKRSQTIPDWWKEWMDEKRR